MLKYLLNDFRKIEVHKYLRQANQRLTLSWLKNYKKLQPLDSVLQTNEVTAEFIFKNI
jgi:hypothetical protein